jgi:hypothetical protein
MVKKATLSLSLTNYASHHEVEWGNGGTAPPLLTSVPLPPGKTVLGALG